MSELYLLKCVVDTRALLAFAKSQGLLRRELDDGYLIHAAFAALFGDRAPKPFVLERTLDADPPQYEGAVQTVLAYANTSIGDLHSLAADPHRGLVRWDSSASKPMPEIPSGREVCFVTRVTPTVRSRSATPERPAGGRGNGREVDAFLAACFRARDASVDRATVYRDWLARELSVPRGVASSPATLTDYALRGFKLASLLRKERRGAADKRHVLERPDAVIAGALRVDDTAAFRALLARGVGRHRAFGFGMLLLRPSR